MWTSPSVPRPVNLSWWHEALEIFYANCSTAPTRRREVHSARLSTSLSPAVISPPSSQAVEAHTARAPAPPNPIRVGGPDL